MGLSPPYVLSASWGTPPHIHKHIVDVICGCPLTRLSSQRGKGEQARPLKARQQRARKRALARSDGRTDCLVAVVVLYHSHSLSTPRWKWNRISSTVCYKCKVRLDSHSVKMVITTDKDKLTRPLNFILKKARTPSADGRKQVGFLQDVTLSQNVTSQFVLNKKRH